MCHGLICFFNRDAVSIYYEPGTLLNTEDAMLNKRHGIIKLKTQC